MKICTKCKKLLPEQLFKQDKQKKDGLSSSCRQCHKEYWNAWRSNPANAKKHINKSKKYYLSHTNERKKYLRLYVEKNKERLRIQHSQYNRTIRKQKRKLNPYFKIENNMRKRIWSVLKRQSKRKIIRKADKTYALIGCTVQELVTYLEKQFTDGMSWGNYGQWHVDHIIPCHFYDLKNEQSQRECFHYSNLRPLWARDNLRRPENKIKGIA